MDTVEYISASTSFAIVRRGEPEEVDVDKELQDLLDMRPGRPAFAAKQLPQFLARYGRQFEHCGDLAVATSDLDPEDVRRLAGADYERAFTGPITLSSDKLGITPADEKPITFSFGGPGLTTFVPSPETYGTVGDRYAVDLTDHKRPESLVGTMDKLRYVANLGLVAQGFEGGEVRLEPSYDATYHSVRYDLTPPPSLTFEGMTLDGEEVPLFEGVTRYRRDVVFDAFGFDHMCLLLEREDQEGGRRWEFMVTHVKRSIECLADGTQRQTYALAGALPDGKPDEADLNRFAASQLLSMIEDGCTDRRPRFEVDPATLRLRPSHKPYLVGELVERIAAGKVHPCERCGRPIMGGSWYCRSGRCHQAALEAARRLAAGGLGADEIAARYPHIRRATIDGYITDAERERRL